MKRTFARKLALTATAAAFALGMAACEVDGDGGTDPTPVDPVPTDPAPTDPAPTDPAPTDPPPAP